MDNGAFEDVQDSLVGNDFHCDSSLPEGKTPRQGRPDVEANLVKLLFFFGMWLSYPEILEFLAD